MLVLTRGRSEKIIAGDITITVVGFRDGGRVRLGIDAPHDLPVHRKEVHDAIVREHGPYPETRRVPVELLKEIADILACGYGGGIGAAREAVLKILEPRKDGR